MRSDMRETIERYAERGYRVVYEGVSSAQLVGPKVYGIFGRGILGQQRAKIPQVYLSVNKDGFLITIESEVQA